MKYTVNPGYTVHQGKKQFGPGEEVDLDEKEGQRLQNKGIVSPSAAKEDPKKKK